MKMILVKYRTSDHQYNQYAMVPSIYISDLCDWLKLSECAEIISVENPPHEISDFFAPKTWPSYGTCEEFVRVRRLVQ